jgi:CobQ-like glutamine amidotransferase family enzyme
MNLYADHGNVLVLKKRCEWRNIEAEVIHYEPGDKIPDDIDIIFGGGGQDSGQGKIENDLIKISPQLKQLINDGTPALVICGIYQLFGKYYKTGSGKTIKGINVFNITTDAGKERYIGDVTIKSNGFGEIVGYENHSGLTKLGENMKPLGEVIVGAGNNAKDKTEGCRYKNCIGTYLHGPILPKNPKLTDFFIAKALEHKTGQKPKLDKLDDTVENKAHAVAAKRPR